MKIKRYIAASMRAALSQVRAEQGPDAVILSSRRVNEGIEVIAAVDYDEALIAGAARRYLQARCALRRPPAAPPAAAPPAPPRAAQPATAPPRNRATCRRRAAACRATRSRRAPAPATPAAAKPATAAPAPQGPVRENAPSAVGTDGPRRAPRAGTRASSSATPDHETRLGLATVQRELKDMRMLLESELANLSWHDRRRASR